MNKRMPPACPVDCYARWLGIAQPRLPREAWPLACLGTLATLAALAGCDSPPPPRGPVVLLVSGDTQGRIVPCGCASGQSGGLPRRAALLDDLRRRTELVVLDAGGAAEGTSEYDRVRFEAILRGEILMGLAAHNVGGSEAALGPDYLRRVAADLDLPLVSANTADASGQAIAEPIRVVEAAGRRIAVAGVLGEAYETADIRVSPPDHAVLAALDGLTQPCDHLVVLAYMDEDALGRLASALPEADVVAGGPTDQPLVPRRVGPVLLTSATNKGKFVARLSIGSGNPRPEWSAEIVELTEQFPDEESQLANLRQFYGRLAERDLAASETSFVDRLRGGEGSPAVAGSRSCRECHEEDCTVWEESAHSRAWQSLVEKGAQVDPACQRCHTTGYGLPGGFRSARTTPERQGVGCECCHGPSNAHVEDPLKKTPRFETSADSCPTCHDRENSPQFDYQTYWDEIRHGAADEPGEPSAAGDSQ